MAPVHFAAHNEQLTDSHTLDGEAETNRFYDLRDRPTSFLLGHFKGTV